MNLYLRIIALVIVAIALSIAAIKISDSFVSGWIAALLYFFIGTLLKPSQAE